MLALPVVVCNVRPALENWDRPTAELQEGTNWLVDWEFGALASAFLLQHCVQYNTYVVSLICSYCI